MAEPDIIFKLRVLCWLLGNAWGDWQSQVWEKDLDSQGCCDGRECFCGGETVREQWAWIVNQPHA